MPNTRLLMLLSLLLHHGLCFGITVDDTAEGHTTDIGIQECFDLGNVTKIAHVGWPFHFVPSDIIIPARNENATIYSKHRKNRAKDSFRSPDGKFDWNITDTTVNLRYNNFHYPKWDVMENMTGPFEMLYKIPEISYCSKVTLHLITKKIIENSTCQYLDLAPISTSTAYKESFTLFCQVSYEDFPKIYADLEDLEYEWWYNYTKAFPNSINITGETLLMTDIDFSNGGEYTCAISYMGQRRFIQRYDICVKHGNDGIYTIKCENPTAREGEDLNVTCVVDFGKGQTWYYQYTMNWMKVTTVEEVTKICNYNSGEGVNLNSGSGHQTKVTSTDCQIETTTKVITQNICSARPYQELVNSTIGDPRIQCENVKEGPSELCFRYPPSPAEKKALDQTFRLTMRIKDMKPSDAGKYIMMFEVYANDVQNHTVTISLEDGSTLVAVRYVTIIVSLAFLAIIISVFATRLF